MKKKLIALGMSLALSVTGVLGVSDNVYAFEEVQNVVPGAAIAFEKKDLSYIPVGKKVKNALQGGNFVLNDIQISDVTIETETQRNLMDKMKEYRATVKSMRQDLNKSIEDEEPFSNGLLDWEPNVRNFIGNVSAIGDDTVYTLDRLLYAASAPSGSDTRINPNAYQDLEDIYYYLDNELYLAHAKDPEDLTQSYITTRSSIENQCDAWTNFLTSEITQDQLKHGSQSYTGGISQYKKAIEIRKKALQKLFNDLDVLKKNMRNYLDWYKSSVLTTPEPTVLPTTEPELAPTTIPASPSQATTVPTSTETVSPTNTVSSTDMPSKEEQPQATSTVSNGAITASEPVIIKYNVVSGSAIEPTTGSTENLPKVTEACPVREGYSFQGWIDEVGNPRAAGTIIEKNTTLTAQWKEIEFEWNIQIKDTTSSKIKLSVQDKNTSTTYIPLRKKLVLKLEGSRDSSEGSTPVVFQYQIVNKGNEYVETEMKPVVNGIISVSSSKKCRIYIRAISGKNSRVYRTNGFYIDSAAPKISGIKNGKIYKKSVKIRVSDKVSGVKKILLNGKKIKSGKVVSKKGAYKLVVMDVAGNKKSVRFAIMR